MPPTILMTYCSISMYFTIIIGSYWLLDGEILNIELDDGKIYRKALYLMVKTMVSCRFSLKSIQWTKHMTKPLGCSVAPWLVTICRPACCGADAAAPLFRGGGPGVHPRHATGGVVELGPVRHGMKSTENHAKPCRELMIFLVLDVFSRSRTSSFFDLCFRCFQCSLCCVLMSDPTTVPVPPGGPCGALALCLRGGARELCDRGDLWTFVRRGRSRALGNLLLGVWRDPCEIFVGCID